MLFVVVAVVVIVEIWYIKHAKSTELSQHRHFM